MPSMSQPVMIGRWLTPLISIFILRMSHSRSSESMNVAIVTSWQRPTALIDVSRKHRTRERRHRVGEVEHPRVGAHGLHVARDVDHDRDVAQRADDAARADRVTDRLLDAVALGDRDVAAHALERSGGDADDDVVGTVERFALVRSCRSRGGRCPAPSPCARRARACAGSASGRCPRSRPRRRRATACSPGR